MVLLKLLQKLFGNIKLQQNFHAGKLQRKIIITDGIFSVENILIIYRIYRRKVFHAKMLEFLTKFIYGQIFHQKI